MSDLDHIVGPQEIADRLGVTRQSVDNWRQRPKVRFPPPAREVSGRPIWDWGDVEAWAGSTGRLPAYYLPGDEVVVTTSGDPSQQYAALMIYVRRQRPGWLPARSIEPLEVEVLLAELACEAAEGGVWLGWSEPHVDPVEYASGPVRAIVARRVTGAGETGG